MKVSFISAVVVGLLTLTGGAVPAVASPPPAVYDGTRTVGAVPEPALQAAVPQETITSLPDSDVPAETLNHRQQITDIFNRVNAHRAENGLGKLMFSVPASEESQAWSKNIAEQQYLSHTQSPGLDPRIKAVFWDYWAENVAYRQDDNAHDMFDQWVNSPSHNINLLSPKINTIGIGLFTTGNRDAAQYPKNYYMWGTQQFYNFPEELPAQTYAHPDDYFEGRDSLNNPDKLIVIRNPNIDHDRGTYSLLPVEGVRYFVNGTEKVVGTYSGNWEKVTIEYRPIPGYRLAAGKTSYIFEIDFSLNIQETEAAHPQFTDSTGTYRINESWGVEYYVNGVLKPPGTYDSGWVNITVVAKAKPGYRLKGTTSWSHQFKKPEVTPTPKPTPTPAPTPAPPAPVVAVSPKIPAYDKAAGKYAVPATAGVDYKVNGTIRPAGSYDGSRSRIVITAVAKKGYRVVGDASWAYTFVDARSAQDFRDTKGTAFAGDIRWMRASGISTGWADNTYRPYSNITRDAMAAFIYRMAGSPAFTPPAKTPFSDVSTNNMYYKEITWLASSGITTGWSDGTFRPGAKVNRDAMAAFMYRFGSMCSIPSVDQYKVPAGNRFVDVPSGAAFHKEISWMSSTGITTGWADRTFRPLQSVTREEMAAFLSRLDTFLADSGGC